MGGCFLWVLLALIIAVYCFTHDMVVGGFVSLAVAFGLLLLILWMDQ